jgi:hypothetical protein
MSVDVRRASTAWRGWVMACAKCRRPQSPARDGTDAHRGGDDDDDDGEE